MVNPTGVKAVGGGAGAASATKAVGGLGGGKGLGGLGADALGNVNAKMFEGLDARSIIVVDAKAADGVDAKAVNADPEGFATSSKNWLQENPGKAAIGAVGTVLLVEGIISSEESAKCLNKCLPSNYRKSKESGLGSLSRDEMEYQTGNNPHCNEDNTDCMEYCSAECDDGTWAQTLGEVTGKTVGVVGKAAGETAGEVTKGIFAGLGLGPIMIVVVIVIILIVLVTMM